MGSSPLGRQTLGLLRRHAILIYRHPLSSLIRLVMLPGYSIVTSANLGNKSEEGDELESSLEGGRRAPTIILFCTIFNVVNFGRLIVDDKATGIKSLMISMGLHQNSYYLANGIYFTVCNVVPMTAIATKLALHLYSDSQASFMVIVMLHLLLILHLMAFVFVVGSLAASDKVISTAVTVLLFEVDFHAIVKHVMFKSDPKWWSVILFMASVSPYESVRIFTESYLNCKNCDETRLSSGNVGLSEIASIASHGVVSQPTHLIFIAMLTWTVVALAASRWLDELSPWQTDFAFGGPSCCMNKDGDRSVPMFEDDSTRRSEHFERPPPHRGIGIHAHGISKKYRDVTAVNNVDFNVYKGEITVLLGHNGAGKTTLMDMMLGKLQPDSGCVVGGSRQARLDVGYCPQTSVLDGQLSVRQNLELFNDIKSVSSVSKRGRNEHLIQILGDIGLSSQMNTLASELSRGMKRKLSLGMVFVGNSGVLILDDPSVGLDPDSRMLIWNTIRSYRSNRLVVLSTQHMEEADYLGDWIAIMKRR